MFNIKFKSFGKVQLGWNLTNGPHGSEEGKATFSSDVGTFRIPRTHVRVKFVEPRDNIVLFECVTVLSRIFRECKA